MKTFLPFLTGFRRFRKSQTSLGLEKPFSLIDDDFNKVQGHLDIIREKIDYQVNELNDNLEKKEFELRVDVKNLTENFEQTVTSIN